MKKTPLKRKTAIRKKRRPPEKGPSEALLDHWFSKAVRSLALYECQLAGFTGQPCSSDMQCSHIYTRSSRCTRWDLDGAICACSRCHRYQHNMPLDSHDWLLEVLGEEHIERLRAKYIANVKPTIDDKIQMLADFKRIVKEYEDGV